MPVKFKLNFTIDAETLFGILSKFMPIQDLSVEEVIEQHPIDRYLATNPTLKPAVSASKYPPRAKQVRKTRGSGYALNPYAGFNVVFLSYLADGKPHKIRPSYPMISAAGLSPNGMYGKVERLCRHGLIRRISKGTYQLTDRGMETWRNRPASIQESAA